MPVSDTFITDKSVVRFRMENKVAKSKFS